MSFSDVGKRRRQRQQQQQLQATHHDHESSIAKNQARKAPSALRCFYGNSRQPNTSLEPGREMQEEYDARSTPRRGVRPHLNNVCPVTSKPLMEADPARDDENSAATSFSYDFEDDAADDDPFPAPVRSPHPRQADSEFAMLNKEIVNFQKMVADFEQAMETSAESPEAQWKTRILMRSSQEAQQDIQNRLVDFADASHRRRDVRGQMALRKLKRDFARVQDHYNAVTLAHQRQQMAEVSMFQSSRHVLSKNNDEEEQPSEEFFDRAMREREAEVANIHQSMRKVNAIYKDLAGIVDGQQEQIDKLADKVEESKTNTKYGMDQIHEAVMGMCAPLQEVDSPWSLEDIYDMATSCTAQVEEGLCKTDDR